MKEHAGLTLVVQTLASAAPERCWIHRHGTAAAYFVISVDGIPGLRLSVSAAAGELGGELVIAGLGTETLPVYRGQRLPAWSGDHLIARGGMGRPWTLVPEAGPTVGTSVLPYLTNCWEQFVADFRGQWLSAPAQWLERAEYLVEHPRFSAVATQQAAEPPGPIDFPSAATPCLESAENPERFVLAALGFGGVASSLLPTEPAARVARLTRAAAKGRRVLREDCAELRLSRLEDWTPTSG